MLILLHSGQTGVERGAARAARAAGIPVAGFSSAHHRDEFGALPPVVARELTPCHRPGARSAVAANIAIASAVLLVVPQAGRVTGYPAVVAREARVHNIPCRAVDPDVDRAGAIEALVDLASLAPTSGSTRVFITGPRETRWEGGARFGALLVGELATQLGLGIGGAPA